MPEAAQHPHNIARGSFSPTPELPGMYEPNPAPKLSRTPGYTPRPQPAPGADTRSVLGEYGLDAAYVDRLIRGGHAAEDKPNKPASKL